MFSQYGNIDKGEKVRGGSRGRVGWEVGGCSNREERHMYRRWMVDRERHVQRTDVAGIYAFMLEPKQKWKEKWERRELREGKYAGHAG